MSADRYQREMKIYQVLGVERFKRLVLLLEKLHHGRIGRHNRNYHPESLSQLGISRFRWYLLYNGSLHLASIILALLFYACIFFFHRKLYAVRVLVGGETIINLYCILLQRYNYLKLERLQELRRERNEIKWRRFCKAADDMNALCLEKEQYERDTALLAGIERVFMGEEGYFLKGQDIESLKRYGMLFQTIGIGPAGLERKERSISGKAGSILTELENAEPCLRVDRRVEGLRRRLDRENLMREKNAPVLSTEDAECEKYYRSAFGVGSVETVMLRLRLLRYIYHSRVVTEGLENA